MTPFNRKATPGLGSFPSYKLYYHLSVWTLLEVFQLRNITRTFLYVHVATTPPKKVYWQVYHTLVVPASCDLAFWRAGQVQLIIVVCIVGQARATEVKRSKVLASRIGACYFLPPKTNAYI